MESKRAYGSRLVTASEDASGRLQNATRWGRLPYAIAAIRRGR
jgi:hypothetical protein